MGREKIKTDDVISDLKYNNISDLIHKYLGIYLKGHDDVGDVIEKLNPLITIYNCKDIDGLFKLIIDNPCGEVLGEVANKITTNYSYFYREKAHFEFLTKNVLPDLLVKQRAKNCYKLRFWSAACSSGEEAYTLSMLTKEALGIYIDNWDINIWATDISTRVLKEAKLGKYSIERTAETPSGWTDKYFEETDDKQLIVNKDVRKNVNFEIFNLKSGDYFSFTEKYHVIFCRNVFIYFDEDTICEIAGRICSHLEKGGYFFIGVSETLKTKLRNVLDFISPGIYKKK